MKTPFTNSLARAFTLSIFIFITACGGADTTIIEQDPIIDDGHDHDHEGEHGGTAIGRLLVLNASEPSAQVYDLEDSDLLASISLEATPSAVYATGGYRFAALIERNADKVSFIDGGLWQEAHDDHFDLFSISPTLSSFSLSGSRPTHFVTHDDQVALFLDGDSSSGNNAGVLVFDDHMIEQGESPFALEFPMAMHGVAEPRGDHLLATIRRDDADSSSTNTVLPDQVGLYHLHDDEYELEETFTVNCPDLHGAAQNESYIIFGCSDGVLLVTDNGDGSYSAQKLVNPEEILEGIRIGSIWGHHEAEQFIGMASAHGGSTVQFFAIDPVQGEIDLIDWQPMTEAAPIARGFSYEGEQFVILDNQGYLTVLEVHEEGGRSHWEYGDRLDITEADVSTMPEGMNFSITFSQNSHTAYIADPLEQHVLEVDLELLNITADIELDYAPAKVVWLGVAEAHDH